MRYETDLFTAFVTFHVLDVRFCTAGTDSAGTCRQRKKTVAYIDSLYRELPEVMITGERPVVKSRTGGNWVYDVPRLVGSLPVDNAYDAVKNLPGVVSMNDALMLGGQPVTVVINGKVTPSL